MKQQIYQQIANQQVQQVMANQREQGIQQLQADFNAWQTRQNEIAQLQAEYDAWNAQNNPQPQPKQTIPSIADTQPKRDLQAEAREYFANVRKERAAEEAEAKRVKEQQLKATINDYARQQQEENMLASNSASKKKEPKVGQRPGATDFSSQVAARVTNEKKPEINTANVPVNVDRWLSPDTKLTEAEKKKAKEYASVELQKVQYGPNKQPLLNTPEERQHYADMVNLINKTNGFTNFMSGAIEVPYNLADMVSDGARSVGNQLGGLGAAITDKLGITEGATQRHNEQAEIANQFADQNEANMRQSFKNAQTQNPGAYTAGKIAGQTGMYMLTNPVFDGIAAGAGVESELAKFFINQGAQNVQDLVLDTAPTVRQLMEDGSTPEEVKREALSNILWNVAGNAVMGGLGAWAGNRATRNASDEAFRENVRAGADNLSRIANEIPGIEDVDNVVRNATRQAETAAQNIENLNKQIPNLPDYVTGGPTGAYDVAKAIEPEPIKEPVEEVAKSGPELSAETQEQIASDFEEIYNAVEDMRSIVESSGDAKIAEKYSKLQDAVWDYEKKVYQSDSLEEINKAKKAADAARQGFIRAAKKIDPNFKGSLTGTKLGNAEFRRTSTAPTDSALLDEIVDDMVKQDMENPNRFVRDAKPDNVNVYRGVNSEEPKDYSIQEVNRKGGKKGYYVAESVGDGATKNVEPGKVYKTKEEAENALGNYKLQTFAGGDGLKENWKTSKLYTNTATKKGWSDKLDAKDYGYRATNAQEQESVFNNRYKDSKDIVRDLVELDAFDDADMRGAMNTMEKLMDGSIDDIRKASRLGKKISFEGREGGRVVQAISEAKANTPAGQMRQAQQKIGEAIDNRVGKGTSEALDNLYEEISQAYEKAKNKDEFADAIKKLLNGDLKEHVSKKTAKEMESKKIKGLKKILEMINKGEDLKDISIDDLMEVMYKSNGGVTISPTSQKEIYQLLQEASKYDPESYEFRSLQAQAARKVMAEVPSGLRDYVRTFLYDNMLGNFKTAFSRNLLGNVAFQSLEKAREPISAGVDKLVSNFTGKHSALTWNKEKRKAFKQGIKKGAIETISDANPTKNANTLRSGQHGFEEALAHNTTTFNDNKPIGHWLNQVDYYVKKAMELGDRPIYEGNYQEFKTELEQLVQRYGKDNVAGLEKVDDADVSAVIDRLAALRAADSVFQKKGHMSKGLTHFREGLSELSKGALGIDVLSTASTPFTMTPGNMLEKAVEYTPLGAVKNGIETALELSKGSFDQRRFVEEAGRTITGLPVLGAAYGGAKLGLINNGLSNDPDEKSAQIDDGFIEYGLNIPKQVPLVGGKSYDTSDLPVYGPFMQAGAVMAEDGLSPRSSLQAVEAVIGGSSMQGIRKAFGADNATYNSNDKILDNFIHTVKSSGTQFVPSLIRQTAQTTDKYKRDLGEYKTNEYYLNSIKNAVPILRETLPIKYDTEGRQVLQNQGRNAFSKVFENYILPMNVSEYKPSALNQEASRLLDSTSTHTPQGFVPKASRSDLRKWDEDIKKEYTEDQFRKYKIELGQLNSEAGHAVIEADFYKNLNDDTKAKTLSSVYSAMKTIAKENATGIETDDKIAIAYKKGGIEGMINYLTGKAAVKDSGTTSQSNAGKAIQEAADNGNAEAAYDMSAQVKLLPNYGLDKSGPAATYTKAYGVYGEGYSAEEFAKTYKAIDSDHNQGVKQDEIINYLNKEQITSQDKADQIWSAFGSDSWDYIPSIKDGVWTKKKR